MQKVIDSQEPVSEEVSSQLLSDLEEAKKKDEKLEKMCDYLQRGFLSNTHPNGYPNWEYAKMLASGETDDTTNNAAEALNSQYGKFAVSGVSSYAQMLTSTYQFHVDYTESCAEKRQNDAMNKRSEKIQKKIDERVKKIRAFRQLPRQEQNKCFIQHLQLLKLAPISNQKTQSQEFSDEESASEASSETGSM